LLISTFGHFGKEILALTMNVSIVKVNPSNIINNSSIAVVNNKLSVTSVASV
jgi:hypothetical protein